MIALPSIETCFKCFGTQSSDAKKIKRRQQNPRNSKFTQINSIPPPKRTFMKTIQQFRHKSWILFLRANKYCEYKYFFLTMMRALVEQKLIKTVDVMYTNQKAKQYCLAWCSRAHGGSIY